MTKSTQKKIVIGFFLYFVSLGTLSGFLLIKNVWLFFSMTGVAWIFSLSVCIITFILSWRAVQNYIPPDPEKFLFIKRDQIPWSTIDTISLIKGTLGNQILVFYFNDGTPPKSYNFDKLKKKDELILSIKEHASKNKYNIDLNV